ncbi:MAG: hypothetical protein R2856_26705 [Caldilineaceae bacterium]
MVTNTAYFSGTAQQGSGQAAYAASKTLHALASGNWNDVFPTCSVCDYVIPDGFNVEFQPDIELAGNFTIENGGSFDANGHIVTLTGDLAQTLKGSPVTFYMLTLNKPAPIPSPSTASCG